MKERKKLVKLYCYGNATPKQFVTSNAFNHSYLYFFTIHPCEKCKIRVSEKQNAVLQIVKVKGKHETCISIRVKLVDFCLRSVRCGQKMNGVYHSKPSLSLVKSFVFCPRVLTQNIKYILQVSLRHCTSTFCLALRIETWGSSSQTLRQLSTQDLR